MRLFATRAQPLDAEHALPGREEAIAPPMTHAVLGTSPAPPFPAGVQTLVVGLGCFWGAERIFWQAHGVYSTAAGYAGGFTPNPTYGEVCSGRTGHAEVVLVAFDTAVVSLDEILRLFWEGHDPTQGMRQGNDVGTQYRSILLVEGEAQRAAAQTTRDAYAQRLREAGHGDVTTEISPRGDFCYAEEYHQQYLFKNPNGYCGIGGTGVSCPIGAGAA